MCLSSQYCIQQSTSSLSGSRAPWREPLRYLSPFCSQHLSRGVPNQTEEFVGATTKPEMCSNFSYIRARRTVLCGLLKANKAFYFFLFFFTILVVLVKLNWDEGICSVTARYQTRLSAEMIFISFITEQSQISFACFVLFCFVYFMLFWQNNAFNA